MKKFRFRYESVLKMRMDTEERIKNELAKWIAKRQSLLDDLADLSEKSHQYDLHVEDIFLNGDPFGERSNIAQSKQYYKQHKQIISAEIKRVEQIIKEVQEKLVEAMKERKVMDKLKEKAFQEFVDAINEADAKLIEEVVNYSNNKKNGE